MVKCIQSLFESAADCGISVLFLLGRSPQAYLTPGDLIMAYVLIVDDDTDFTGALSTALKGRGHETAIETDAEKAVERIRERLPDIGDPRRMFPENGEAGFDVARRSTATLATYPSCC